MRCRTARKLLSRRLDDRLGEAESKAVGEHLSGCPSCALEAARLDRAWARLGALPPAARAPDDFAAVMEAVESRRRGWLASLLPPLPRRPAWAMALAASVIVGSTAGATLGKAAFGARGNGASPEALALSEGFGLLPFDSPAAGLARALTAGTEGHE